MLFGKVAGTVVSTRKAESLEGLKLLLVRNVDVTGEVAKGYVVAADSVGAGLGEVVLYATGSSARQTDITNGKPVDAVIMGIVDTWDVDDKTVYMKYASANTSDV